MTRTRVVTTLGPASSSEAVIAALVDAGVDVFRLNFSHGTFEEHGAAIATIRRVAGTRPVAVLQDLAGPKLRLQAPISGEPGDVVTLPLPPSVRAGDPVLLADGLMQLEVIDPSHSKIVIGGEVPAGKGINLPSSRLDDIPALTDHDRASLRFGLEHGVDLVALSFVRRAGDLDEVRASGVPVIAKMEKAEAVEHADAIVAAADGIMVARGDLGVEIPFERVPIVQKQLIALANAAAKPVITATQMLRSMVASPLPARAEATDVANAVLDGSDALMLSEETAVGAYPVETVRAMHRIAAAAEPFLAPRFRHAPDVATATAKIAAMPPAAASEQTRGDHEVADVIAHAACEMAARVDAAAIIVPTQTGTTARMVASLRPRVPIIVLTRDLTLRRRLSLVWGITALVAPWLSGGAPVLERFRDPVRAAGIVPAGARIVVTAGWPFAAGGISNLVHIATL